MQNLYAILLLALKQFKERCIYLLTIDQKII